MRARKLPVWTWPLVPVWIGWVLMFAIGCVIGVMTRRGLGLE